TLALGQDGLFGFDAWLSGLLEEHAQEAPLLLALVGGITRLGDTGVLLTAIAAVALVLAVQSARHRLHDAWLPFWIMVTLGGLAFNGLLKELYHRPRPQFHSPIVDDTGWSFPSGHAMKALVVYGALAYLLLLAIQRPLLRLAAVLG